MQARPTLLLRSFSHTRSTVARSTFSMLGSAAGICLYLTCQPVALAAGKLMKLPLGKTQAVNLAQPECRASGQRNSRFIHHTPAMFSAGSSRVFLGRGR